MLNERTRELPVMSSDNITSNLVRLEQDAPRSMTSSSNELLRVGRSYHANTGNNTVTM